MKEHINFNETVVLDGKELDSKGMFDDIYLVFSEKSLSFSIKSELEVDGRLYPVEAVSFVGENTYAIRIEKEEE